MNKKRIGRCRLFPWIPLVKYSVDVNAIEAPVDDEFKQRKMPLNGLGDILRQAFRVSLENCHDGWAMTRHIVRLQNIAEAEAELAEFGVGDTPQQSLQRGILRLNRCPVDQES